MEQKVSRLRLFPQSSFIGTRNKQSGGCLVQGRIGPPEPAAPAEARPPNPHTFSLSATDHLMFSARRQVKERPEEFLSS